MITDSSARAHLLNDYFSSIFVKENLDFMPNIPNLTIPEMEPIHIQQDGVKRLLENLEISKATGPDGIPSRFLKDFSDAVAPPLTIIFKATLHQGCLPSEWKHATVVPVFKKGDRHLVSNYRPISLTCICCKVLEHIIYSSISSHLEKHNIICEEQHGFQKHKSCETQLIYTTHDFASVLNSGGEIDALFLDFSKAFDKVPHVRLYHKLEHYRICPQILNWIGDFLKNRHQRVVLNGISSTRCEVLSGVPQGTVLGPLLFNCYINDITNIVNSKIRLYADDILLYRSIVSTEDSVLLQKDLDAIATWSKSWLMSFNYNKCSHLKISNKLLTTTTTYFIDTHEICKSNSATYLGVTIDQHLNWTDHIHKTVSKANAANAFLKRNIRSCPITVRKMCYMAMVRPILEYASIIWFPHTKSGVHKVEMVQRRAVRFIMNNYSYSASVTNMLTQLNLPTLQQRCNRMKLIMMYKIVNCHVQVGNIEILIPLSSHTRGHHHRFLQPHSRIDSHLYSFFPSAISVYG